MLQRNRLGITAVLGAAFVVLGASGCSQQPQAAATSAVEEKSFSVTPSTVPVRVAFLSGELRDLKVTERVEPATGRVVDLPRLTGTLRLKNTSEDRAARLLGGKVEFVDAQGALIPLAEGRGAPTFSFYSYSLDRLDPGKETTQSVDLPFPASVLKDRTLRDLRLEVAYIPSPYKEEHVDLAVSVKH
jgi:hypothetical protein